MEQCGSDNKCWLQSSCSELLTSLLNYFVLNSLLAFWPGLNLAQRLQPLFTPVYTGHATGICDCAPSINDVSSTWSICSSTKSVLDSENANESAWRLGVEMIERMFQKCDHEINLWNCNEISFFVREKI